MRRFAMVAALASAAVTLSAQANAEGWSGFYVGGHVGYGFLAEDDETLEFDTDLNGSFGDTVLTGTNPNAFSPGFCDGAPNGNNAGAGCQEDEDEFDFGFRVGYDWDMPGFVLGVVGEISVVDVEDNVTGFSTTPAAYTFTRELNSIAALRGRIGAPFAEHLLYATAGLAWGELDRSFSTTNTVNSFTPRGGDDANGYQVGGGLETRVGEHLTLGFEYLYTSLDDEGYVVRFGPGTAPPTNPFLFANPNGTDTRRSDDTLDLHALRLTLNYRFGGM